MPEDGAPARDISRSEIGLAPAPDKPDTKWHLWLSDPVYEGNTSRLAQVRTICGAYRLEHGPAEVPRYIPIDESAAEWPLPDFAKPCAGCTKNWASKRSSKRLAEQKKADELQENAVESVLALHLRTVKVPSNPPVWWITFGRGKSSWEFTAESADLAKADMFCIWWMDTFAESLHLTKVVWIQLINQLLSKAVEVEAEAASKEEEIYETACDILRNYRIVAGPSLMGTRFPRAVFIHDGRTWMVLADLLTKLKEKGYELTAQKTRRTLGESLEDRKPVILGESRQIWVKGVNRRCWPISPENAGMKTEVLGFLEMETEKQAAAEAAQTKLDAAANGED